MRRRQVLLTPLALVAAVARTRAQPDPTFRARVQGVRLDVLVTEGGRPLPGLGPADFEVRDNGVVQTIEIESLRDVPVGVVLTLDLSESVAGPKLDALRRGCGALLDSLLPNDTAALVTFNTGVTERVSMTAEVARVRQAIDAATTGGDTALVDATLAAMLVGDSDAGRTLIVVFSDGLDTASFSTAEAVIETARRVNGVLYGVWTGGEEPPYLRTLAAATGGRVLRLTSRDDPSAAFVEILQEFRRRYVITFTPTGVTGAGWHRLEVRVPRRGARVQTRTGYFAAPPE